MSINKEIASDAIEEAKRQGWKKVQDWNEVKDVLELIDKEFVNVSKVRTLITIRCLLFLLPTIECRGDWTFEPRIIDKDIANMTAATIWELKDGEEKLRGIVIDSPDGYDFYTSMEVAFIFILIYLVYSPHLLPDIPFLLMPPI